MEQHQVIKIPMSDTIFDELDDAFIDQKESAHDFVWGLIRTICRDSKMGKLNKACTIMIVKDGQQVQDQVKLKGYELEQITENSEWLPKHLSKEDVKYFEHKVTDRTMEYLRLYGSFAILRHDKLADSLEEEDNKKIAEMIKNKVSDDLLNDAKTNFAEANKKFRESKASCIEEAIFNEIYRHIHKMVMDNVDREFDKENESLYPKEEKQKKPSR